jgi:hypothetical protein
MRSAWRVSGGRSRPNWPSAPGRRGDSLGGIPRGVLRFVVASRRHTFEDCRRWRSRVGKNPPGWTRPAPAALYDEGEAGNSGRLVPTVCGRSVPSPRGRSSGRRGRERTGTADAGPAAAERVMFGGSRPSADSALRPGGEDGENGRRTDAGRRTAGPDGCTAGGRGPVEPRMPGPVGAVGKKKRCGTLVDETLSGPAGHQRGT